MRSVSHPCFISFLNHYGNKSLPDNYSEGGHTLNHAIKTYTQSHSAEKKNRQIYWPKPLKINFLQIKDADDVATIYCKIGSLVIPCAMIDTGSDSSIFSNNIAELVEELLGTFK